MDLKKHFCLIILLFAVSCSEQSPRNFDSEVWKSGDYTARAAMVKDINKNHLSKIQTKADALQLLGEPEYKSTDEDEDVWTYKIIVLPRCRFIWTCGARIRFDKKTNRNLGEVISYD